MMTVIKKTNHQNAMEMCVSNYTGETSGKLLRTGKFNWEGISTTLDLVCSKPWIRKDRTLQMRLDSEWWGQCGCSLLNGRECSLRSGQNPRQASRIDSLHVLGHPNWHKIRPIESIKDMVSPLLHVKLQLHQWASCPLHIPAVLLVPLAWAVFPLRLSG